MSGKRKTGNPKKSNKKRGPTACDKQTVGPFFLICSVFFCVESFLREIVQTVTETENGAEREKTGFYAMLRRYATAFFIFSAAI